jgi:HPt (histidine-containing phosphotransfer) domain-containing protein
MDAYLSKPIHPAELRRAVAACAPAPAAVVDRAEALANMAGDPQLLRELIGVFLAECPGWLGAARAALAAGNAAELRRSAHTIRGAVTVFGARPAVAAAQRLEEAGRSGELAHAGDAVADLERALELVKPALADLAAAP